MDRFTKEDKAILESNPNIQAVLSNQVLYTQRFKEDAIKEYESGKSANHIFEEAGINTSILSKWRNANRKKINIHYTTKKIINKDSAYEKLLKRNEYLEAEVENTNSILYF